MKTIIYYFSGTGNSLAAAKKIAAVLGDCELVPIASLKDTAGDIVTATDRIGIVAPVYDFGLPAIVAEFLARLDLRTAGYTFCVLTMGGIGASALHQANAVAEKKNGRPFDAAWVVRMVGNFVPLYSPAEGAKKEKTLAAADKKIQDIADAIQMGITVRPRIAPFSSLLKRLMYEGFIRQIREMDRQFITDEKCTHCGTCSRVCPVKNIVMVEEKPQWLHHCELCMACLNLCPAQAIQWTEKTKNRGRYRHPALKIADMKAQRGEAPEE
ncbi:EFR1 family ferrodoxin [Methanoregula sp.]|uniref:EFR1 family ferrodoxin n=1 Tax=Methanoregula sp. TaxID=2052170 RepID=UPI000CC98FC6|nr:EFR1 family ferrodoxin [Methanoregula sp.]PKG31934.1 MAG: 4Fe-4S ferredoxin [Methanoregula sp.]